MAYAASGLKLMVPHLGSGPAVWHYASGDARTTIEGAGYFSDAGQRGMKTGDAVIVSAGGASALATIHSVTGVSSGTATINAAVLA